MREIVMDTETTGLDPQEGHKVVEIGALELLNHIPTGKTFHKYINPKRSMPKAAFDVHGLSYEFLKKHPTFEEVAKNFLEFIGTSRLIIHNASFDIKFLNSELDAVGYSTISHENVLDTLTLARQKFPGSPASLDALSRRFNIDVSKREKHGAIIDSEILAAVYLELIGGRQPGFELLSSKHSSKSSQVNKEKRERRKPLLTRLNEVEMDRHKKFVDKLGDKALWKKFPS